MPEPQDNLVLTRFLLRKLLDDLYLGLTPSLCDDAGEHKFKVNVTAASGCESERRVQRNTLLKINWGNIALV